VGPCEEQLRLAWGRGRLKLARERRQDTPASKNQAKHMEIEQPAWTKTGKREGKRVAGTSRLQNRARKPSPQSALRGKTFIGRGHVPRLATKSSEGGRARCVRHASRRADRGCRADSERHPQTSALTAEPGNLHLDCGLRQSPLSR